MDLGENPTLIEMIIEAMSEEFPEFLMAVAEENWIRGYHQALEDVSVGQQEYERHQARENLNNENDSDN